MKPTAGIFALLLTCFTTTAVAQDDRTLHWRRLDVNAHLDADGRLRVLERQAIVFTGDWNGGERTFNIRPGQKIDLQGITRIDANGKPHPLDQGDLEYVDNYDWTDGSTVRWRSRLPNDAPFLNQEIIYELDYTLSNILIPEASTYTLDHDFAIPQAAGIIESYGLDLTVDDIWKSTTPLPLHREETSLEPGTSVVVNLPLQYTGAGYPAGVARGLALPTRLVIVLMLLGAIGVMLRRFFADERARGRFEPLVPVEAIDQAWLDQNVFNIPPEVVGTIWDNSTSSPEVAAMIARMVQEGKLASRVETKKWRDVLHLELLVKRADLGPDERRLIVALFPGDGMTTDTERIKKLYARSGFDPAGLISDGIERQIKALVPVRKAKRKPIRIAFNAFCALVVVVASMVAFTLSAAPVLVVSTIVIIFACFVALVKAGMYRSTVIDTHARARRIATWLSIAALPIVVMVLGLYEKNAALSVASLIGPTQGGLPLIIAWLILYVCWASLILKAARTDEDPEKLALRRTLAAGRSFFVRELGKKEPALSDAWFPYLLAFGLGKHVDKWFKSFGGELDHAIATTSGMAAASASSTSWSGGGPLFGGGGGFGGGGSGRTWAAAVGTMSAGVSAPSSSSSGGGSSGGGGGGSSGGGGGGGW